jgi:hypothetical protein
VPGSVVRYPYTNRAGRPGLSLYRPLAAHYADDPLPATG